MNTKREIAAKVRSNCNVHICFQLLKMTRNVQGLTPTTFAANVSCGDAVVPNADEVNEILDFTLTVGGALLFDICVCPTLVARVEYSSKQPQTCSRRSGFCMGQFPIQILKVMKRFSLGQGKHGITFDQTALLSPFVLVSC